jgi:hypothetical protein
MSDRDRHLDRLAKLLALAGSPNACEAASARRAAEALMARHGLRAEEASGRSPSGYYEHPMGARGWTSRWRFALVTAAARYCGAEAIGLMVGERCKVRVAGVRSDVERAVALYEELLAAVLELGRGARAASDELVLEAECYGPRECTDAFRRGAVVGIIALLARSRGEALFRDHHVPVGEAPRAARAEDAALARVEEKRSSRSDRVRSRYQPEEQDVELDDVAALAWFGEGLKEAVARVSVSADGEVVLRDRPEHRPIENNIDTLFRGG